MKDFPVIKFTIAFIIGILILPLIQFSFIVVLLSVLLLILSILLVRNVRFFRNFEIPGTIISVLLVIVLGNFTAHLNERKLNPIVSQLYIEKNITASGKLNQIELKKENEIIFRLKADKFIFKSKIVTDEMYFLCRLKGSDKERNNFYERMKPGFKVEVKGTYSKGKEKRNPGEFDYNAYLNSINILGIITINNPDDIDVIDTTPDTFDNLIFLARKYVDDQLKLLYDNNTAGLLRGLLLADRSEIDYETKTQFINSGVIHVLAVSGLHVGFIAAIIIILLGRFNIYLRSIVTIFGLLAFMFFTGVPPSVFRATVMAIVIILAFITNRSTNIFNSLAIAALIILIISPGEIYSPGFQLSFSAVLAIGVIYPLINFYVSKFRIKSNFLRYLILFFAVSFAAQLGTLPFTLIYFGKISVIALFTNLLVIPAIGLIISLAVTSLIFNVVLSSAALYFAQTNMMVSNCVLEVIKFIGSLNFSHIKISAYSTFDVIIFYLFLTILIISVRKFKSIKAILFLLLFTIVNIFLFSSIDDKPLLPENELSVMAIDVGQGDAILIKFPDKKTALIDAGQATYYYDNGERVIIPLLNYLGIEKIDYGFVSHIDLDHYGGFVSLILNNRVEHIFKPKIDSSLQKDLRFEKFLKERNIEFTYYDHQSMHLDNSRIYILNDERDENVYDLSSNDNSGMIKIVYGNSSFLFTGDAGIKSEHILINNYNNFLDVDVLKVGHHGSKTSSTKEFIKFTSPEYAIVSAGINNKFGHPSQVILDRLQENGSTIFRTDISGAILLIGDGENLQQENWRE